MIAFIIFPFSSSHGSQGIDRRRWRVSTIGPDWVTRSAQVRQTILCYTACVYDCVRTSCVASHDMMAERLHCVLSHVHPNSPTHVR